MKQFLIVLLACISTYAWSGSDKYLEITLKNYTDYEWTISYNNACDDPDDPTDYDYCDESDLNSPDSWSDIETIPAASSSSSPGELEFQLADTDGSGPNVTLGYTNDPDGTLANNNETLTFKFRASKESGSSSCSGNTASNNSYVKSGFAFVTETSCQKGKASSASWTGCSYQKAKSTFKIYYPVAPKLIITLPTNDNAILSKSIIQQTFNHLDPKMFIYFDAYLNNPVAITSSNKLKFWEVCDSEYCWDEYCDNSSNADSSGDCETSYLDGCD